MSKLINVIMRHFPIKLCHQGNSAGKFLLFSNNTLIVFYEAMDMSFKCISLPKEKYYTF